MSHVTQRSLKRNKSEIHYGHRGIGSGGSGRKNNRSSNRQRYVQTITVYGFRELNKKICRVPVSEKQIKHSR